MTAKPYVKRDSTLVYYLQRLDLAINTEKNYKRSVEMK